MVRAKRRTPRAQARAQVQQLVARNQNDLAVLEDQITICE